MTVCQERNDVGIRGIFRALGTLFLRNVHIPNYFFSISVLFQNYLISLLVINIKGYEDIISRR